MSQRFPKEERLKSRKVIGKIFTDGDHFFVYPLTVKYIRNDFSESNKVAFAVPKRRFRKAVDRNAIKRKLKEAYRLQRKYPAIEASPYNIVFIYSVGEKVAFDNIYKSMGKALKRLDSL